MGRCVAGGCLITFKFTGKIFSSGNSAYIYFYRKSKLSQPFRWLNYLNDSILESVLPGGLHHGNLSRSISNDLFISFMRALSLSHADFLYCSVIKYIIKYYRHGQPLPDSHSNMRVCESGLGCPCLYINECRIQMNETLQAGRNSLKSNQKVI